MMTSLRLAFGIAACASALCAAAADAPAAQAAAGTSTATTTPPCGYPGATSLRIFGLTADQRLICFREFSPGTDTVLGPISGLVYDTGLIGIDFRVQDGLLYGVGNAGGVYRIDTTTAVATLVNRLTVPLDGNVFGVDFNPAADRLRVVSDTGQNLRHNLNDGMTTADDPLDYPAAMPVNTPGPTALGIVGSAYTNNDLAADTGTTLFALDSALDQIAIQVSPNDGSLTPTGMLGIDTQAGGSFDIYTSLKNGAAFSNRGYAVLKLGNGRSALFTVPLLIGKASMRGMFRPRNNVIGVAVPLNQ